MDPAQDAQALRAQRATVILYTFIFAGKLVVYLATGVMALLGEALHTLSDIFIYGFLLVAAIYSRRKADAVHMFGYGRAQNVAALVAATLFISFTSYKLYEEAIPRLFNPSEVVYRNLNLALGVIVASMLIAAAPLVTLITQRQRGAAARAQLVALVNDELGLIAAFVGTLFIVWRKPVADPIATIVVATIIAYNAVGLFRENLSVLLGRSPGPQWLAAIEREVRLVPGVLGVHDLRAEYIGPDLVHVGMHIEVSPNLSVRDADRIAVEVDRRVHARVRPGYCVIHVDPATEERAPAAVKPAGVA